MQALPTAIALVFVAISFWLAVRYARLFARSIRRGAPGLPYEPVPDPNPPAPVEPTAGVGTLGVLALVWAGAHFAVAFWWARTGRYVERTVAAGAVVTYFVLAAVVTVIGAVMLLRRRPYGRRGIALGQFLFAIASLMGVAVALVIRGSEDVPLFWRERAIHLAVGFALHVIAATAIGTAAQYVGRPADAPPAVGGTPAA